MMPPKMVPCGFVSRGRSVMRMAGSPYEFMPEGWRRAARPVKRQPSGGRRAVGPPFRAPGTYNGRTGGDIQTLAVLAETPAPARFSTRPRRTHPAARAGGRKVVRRGRIGVSLRIASAGKSDDEETF